MDLGEPSTLDSITLHNRTNCCTNRLSNFYVLLSDTPFGSRSLNELLSDASISQTFHTGLSGSSLDIPVTGETARYVRVQLQGNNPLSLAEVQINGVAGISSSSTTVETTVHYYINDHLSTPQRLVDAAGAISWEATYEAFGAATITTETITQNHRFPGQYYDAESGLYYNWNRYYDPIIGRYVTSDPIGLGGGMNTFDYGYQNPLYWTDREGLNSAAITAPKLIPLPAWAGPAGAVIGAGGAGYWLGNKLYPYISGPLGDAIDYICLSDDAPARDIDFIPGNPDTAVPGVGLDVEDAVDIVSNGGDVIAGDERQARDIADRAGPGKPVRDNPHGPGQRPHYHPTDAHGNRLPGHVLF